MYKSLALFLYPPTQISTDNDHSASVCVCVSHKMQYVWKIPEKGNYCILSLIFFKLFFTVKIQHSVDHIQALPSRCSSSRNLLQLRNVSVEVAALMCSNLVTKEEGRESVAPGGAAQAAQPWGHPFSHWATMPGSNRCSSSGSPFPAVPSVPTKPSWQVPPSWLPYTTQSTLPGTGSMRPTPTPPLSLRPDGCSSQLPSLLKDPVL